MNKLIWIAGIIVVAMVGVLTFATQDASTNALAVSTPDLVQMQSEGVMIVDIRDAESYMTGHIPGSAVDSLEGDTLEKRIKTIHSRVPQVASSEKIVLIGNGNSASSAAQVMTKSGLETYYLQGGINSWIGELSSKKSNTVISPNELHSQIQDNGELYLLDVRQPEELEVTMITESVNIPLAELFAEDISEIPTDKPVVVICATGNRATIATYTLAQNGIDFQVLEGGIKAWDKYLVDNDLR
jgi:rhodanese-related sulfurtransferase